MQARAPAPSQAVPSERGMGYVGRSRAVPSGRTSGDDLHRGGTASGVFFSWHQDFCKASGARRSEWPRAQPSHQELSLGTTSLGRRCGCVALNLQKIAAPGQSQAHRASGTWLASSGHQGTWSLAGSGQNISISGPSLVLSSPVKQELLLKSTRRFLNQEENSCPLLHPSGSWLTKLLQQLSRITGC